MPVAAQLTYKFKVEVDGSPLTPDVEAALLSAVVDDNLHLPDVFQLAFRDPARDVLDRTGVRVGSEVRLKLFSADDPTGEPLIVGEVTAVEAVLDRQGTTTVIRGSDRSHRLQRGRITEAYTDVTYGDVALQVADRLGLKADVEQTTPVFDHVAQVAESDWSFLWRLARSIGFEVVVLDGTLHFRRPERSAAGPGSTTLAGVDPLTLTYGADLIRLTASVTSGEQVEDVEVRSWDLVQKDAVVGRAPAATDSATIGTTPSELAGRFGGGTYVYGRSSPIDPGQADAVATAVAEQIGSTFAELDGTARGNPRLRAGVAVSLSLIGAPFDGKYTVTRSRHVYDPLEGYLVDFSVSGRQDRSLLGMTATDGPSTRFLGVVIGLVSDVHDPEGLGRVKLTFPWLSETFESGWARVSSAGAGADRGFVIVPEVDDEVLVAFEDGDPSFPYVLGGLWNGRDKPPQHHVDGSKGDVRTRTFRTREGSVLTFDDDDGSIRLATPGEKTVVVLTETGASTLQITTSGDTAITSDGNVEVKAARSLSLKADQAIEIAATTSLTLSGAKVDISGDGPVAVSGTPIQLN